MSYFVRGIKSCFTFSSTIFDVIIVIFPSISVSNSVKCTFLFISIFINLHILILELITMIIYPILNALLCLFMCCFVIDKKTFVSCIINDFSKCLFLIWVLYLNITFNIIFGVGYM